MLTNKQAADKVLAAKKAAKRVCFSLEDGAFPIELRQRKRHNFTVIYGLQVKENLDYGQAAAELGECIMHKAACDGVLHND